jgi:protein-disulfide isomerase
MFLGTADAPVVLTEFTDFECPFCAQFHKATFSLKKRFGDRLAISLVHFPLPMHREARSAAAVAECAHAQGRGMQMSDILFLHQDSLGRQPPQWFSRAASVPDTAEFSRCVSSEVTGQRVERGYQIAQRLNISATPTIVLNGWKYGGVPSDSELVADIESLLAQREPHRGMRTLRSTFK